jgi:hypothetical protein
MTPADLLDLRRRAARVLPQDLTTDTYGQGGHLYQRRGAALWRDEHPLTELDHDWLPVIEDDGTAGAMLGELVRRGAAPHVVVRSAEIVPGGDARVVYLHPDGRRHSTLTRPHHGIALALVLVEVAGG